MSVPNSDLLDYAQVAVKLNTSVRTVRRLRARKVLKGLKIGHRTIRFRPADVERAKAKLAGEAVSQW